MKTGDLVGGKYRLVRMLGQGAMGSVWEAVNERASRHLALKLIRQPTEETKQRLLSEARACGSLTHRNIVEVYDVGETETGEPFLVMQLLDGSTLAEYLAGHGRLAPETAAQIGRDGAFALAAAHEKSIIHRDFKPANIFLHKMGGPEAGAIVKVVDFGVSRLLSVPTRVTLPGMMVGSPAYMSPEQFLMSQDIDHRTDIWSLGVCLFEMLTGVRPFPGRMVDELRAQVLMNDAPSITRRRPHLDQGLATIVARCLERDRAKRIGSALELAAMLEPYANARSDAPIIITSKSASVAPGGTVIMAPESIAGNTVAFNSQESPPEDVPRQPRRARPLDEILTETLHHLAPESVAPAQVEPCVAPRPIVREPSAPVLEPQKGLSESGHPTKQLVLVAVAVAVVFVGVTSIVIASRPSSDIPPTDKPNKVEEQKQISTPPKAEVQQPPPAPPKAVQPKTSNEEQKIEPTTVTPPRPTVDPRPTPKPSVTTPKPFSKKSKIVDTF